MMGCNKHENQSKQQSVGNTEPTNKCEKLLSYVDSLPPQIIRRLQDGMILPNGEIIADGLTVRVENAFLRPKSKKECEIYCLLNKDGDIDFNKCRNLRDGIDATVKNLKIKHQVEESIQSYINKNLASHANETIVLKNGITMPGKYSLVLNKDGKHYIPSWGKIEKTSSIWFCEMSPEGLPLENNCFRIVDTMHN